MLCCSIGLYPIYANKDIKLKLDIPCPNYNIMRTVSKILWKLTLDNEKCALYLLWLPIWNVKLVMP